MQRIFHRASAEPTRNDGEGGKIFFDAVVPPSNTRTTSDDNGPLRRRIHAIVGLKSQDGLFIAKRVNCWWGQSAAPIAE